MIFLAGGKILVLVLASRFGLVSGRGQLPGATNTLGTTSKNPPNIIVKARPTGLLTLCLDFLGEAPKKKAFSKPKTPRSCTACSPP